MTSIEAWFNAPKWKSDNHKQKGGLQEMTNTNRPHRRKQRQERRLIVRAVRRDPVDIKKWGGALIELAQAQDEADAEAEQIRRQAVQRRRHNADEPTGGAA